MTEFGDFIKSVIRDSKSHYIYPVVHLGDGSPSLLVMRVLSSDIRIACRRNMLTVNDENSMLDIKEIEEIFNLMFEDYLSNRPDYIQKHHEYLLKKIDNKNVNNPKIRKIFWSKKRITN